MPHSSSIATGFSKKARVQYPDLDEVRQRPAIGLNMDVFKSFREELAEDESVGVIGWSFKQGGLNYVCRIKDEDNSDVYGFGIEMPIDQPYLHRAPSVCIAEKAHMLAVVEQCMSPDKRKQHARALYELEKSCFDENSGVLVHGQRAIHKSFFPTSDVKGYCGLAFPDDMDFLEPAFEKVLALTWDKEDKSYAIDCSDMIPRFQIGYLANPNMPMQTMSRSEAKDALNYVRNKIDMTDHQLFRLCALTGLWNRLDIMSDRLSVFRQPA